MADLCKLADVKAWLSIGPNTTTDDAMLTRLVTATSADFIAEIGRYDFFAADYTEVRRGRSLVEIPPRPISWFSAGRHLILRHWPINSIASFVLDGATVAASPDGLANGYYLDPNTDPENRQTVTLIGYLFTRLSTATITYNAGYSTAPTDVAQAVIEWVAARYRGRASMGGISSLQVAEGRSQSEAAHYIPFDMPKSTQRVVERYKDGTLSLMFSSHD